MPRPNPSSSKTPRSSKKKGTAQDPLASATAPLGPSLVRNTEEDGAPHPIRSLSPEHRQQLADGSGISEEVVAERGYFSVTNPKELAKYGFTHPQRHGPCLVIPVRDVRGEIASYQIRPDSPRVSNDKLLKYEWPKGSRVILDIPKAVHRVLGDPAVPLWITEGAKKADSAVSRGLKCIALSGVWAWRGTNEEGGTAVLSDWDGIALNSRRVIIAFDSDVTVKPAVLSALTRFREMLRSRGAIVQICLLPAGADGRKTGIDDYFVGGGTAEEILNFVSDDLPEEHSVREERGPYFVLTDGTYMNTTNATGEPTVVKIANFVARIEEEIRRDDGVEQTIQFKIVARLPGQIRHALVKGDEFRELDWIHGQLGSAAVVEVGHGPQRICHAVQTLSDYKVVEVYCHTGWRKINETWCFLHAGGAIGPVGPVGPLASTRVDLPDQLRKVRLPTPPTGAQRLAAVQASLSLLQIANHKISWPLLLVAYRAVLGDAGFSLFLVGLTGTRKSSAGAVSQQHFGSDFSLTSLPGNWSSTANATEELLFAAKDILFVLDDFVPPAGMDRGRLDMAADRVLRNVANRSGRQRMRPDGSVRPERPSRAMVLSTGETLPRGHSLMARTFVVELSPGDVDLEQLTRMQGLGVNGTLAAAMAAFVQWLAPQIDLVRGWLKEALLHYRPQIPQQAMHGRTVDAIAEMFFTLDLFLKFALEVGAIGEARAEELRIDGKASLLMMGTAQVAQQAEEDVTGVFLRYLVAALSSGRAHLADVRTGFQPPAGRQEQCGWRPSNNEDSLPANFVSAWIPQGERIGWVDDESVYLEPDVAEAVAFRLARDRGEPISIAGRHLRKRLQAAGHIASRGRGGEDSRLTVRKMIAGTRHDLLHLHGGSLFGERVDQLDQVDHSPDAQGVAHPPAPPPEPCLDAETGPSAAPGVTPPSFAFDTSAGEERECKGPTPPTSQCWTCRSTKYWRSSGGPWTCCTCHPALPGTALEEIDVHQGEG